MGETAEKRSKNCLWICICIYIYLYKYTMHEIIQDKQTIIYIYISRTNGVTFLYIYIHNNRRSSDGSHPSPCVAVTTMYDVPS